MMAWLPWCQRWCEEFSRVTLGPGANGGVCLLFVSENVWKSYSVHFVRAPRLVAGCWNSCLMDSVSQLRGLLSRVELQVSPVVFYFIEKPGFIYPSATNLRFFSSIRWCDRKQC